MTISGPCSTSTFLRTVITARHGKPRERSAAHGQLKAMGSGLVTEPAYVSKSAMGTTAGTIGGYLVPPSMSYALMETIEGQSLILPRANTVPMPTAEVQLPRIDTETVQSAGTPPYFGSVSFTWGASEAPTEISEPAFRQDSLVAFDLLGYAKVSNQWLADAGDDGEQYLTKTLGKAAAWCLDYACFQGTGSAQQMPLGLLQAEATVKVTRAGTGHIAVTDISGMAAKLLPFGWEDAIWACHPSALSDIAKISTYYVNVPGNERGAVGYLLGRPLFPTDKLNALGTSGDLILFSPQLYAVGMRQEVVVDVSEHQFFQTYQTTFRVWLRADGKPILASPITLADGAQTASGSVVLTT